MSTEEQKEQSYRRTVLNTIEKLIDIENQKEIGVYLQNLHGIGWDEVIEERFVNKQCGFPACSGAPLKTKNGQMYHIDKKEGKIYETCKQRSKFCSTKCYHKSFFVRNQLEEQPLWITGLAEHRISKIYEIPDESFICPVIEDESEDTKSPEFVADSIIAQMRTMKLNEEYSEPREKEPDEPEQYELTEDDKDFIQSIKQFKSLNFAAPRAPKIQEKSAEKFKLSPKNQQKEEEIIAKLRAKFAGKPKKTPILIEPHNLSRKTKQKPEEHWLRALLKSWLTPETVKMVKEGARPSGLTEQLIKALMSGKIPEEEKNEVDLPNLDKFNVKEKRLNIFLQSVRNHWLDLEARLHVTPTRRDLLNRVAATFELNSENIVGWSKRELHSIVLVLFLLICQIDVELGDEYFRNQELPSLELVDFAVEHGMDGDGLRELHRFVKSQFAH